MGGAAFCKLVTFLLESPSKMDGWSALSGEGSMNKIENGEGTNEERG